MSSRFQAAGSRLEDSLARAPIEAVPTEDEPAEDLSNDEAAFAELAVAEAAPNVASARSIVSHVTALADLERETEAERALALKALAIEVRQLMRIVGEARASAARATPEVKGLLSKLERQCLRFANLYRATRRGHGELRRLRQRRIQAATQRRHPELLRASRWFDADWYLTTYPAVAATGLDPAEHYLQYGATAGLNPSPTFDTRWYLDAYPDVRSAGLNPLVHYIVWGEQEGRERLNTNLSVVPLSPENQNASTFTVRNRYEFVEKKKIDYVAEDYALYRKTKSSRRVAFYSSIISGSDSLIYHEHLIKNADYYIFSDTYDADFFPYNFRRVPYFDEDPVRSARFIKTHPHILLPNYRIAIWLDGNVMIRADLSGLINAFDKSGLPVAAVPHPLRNSVFEEALECTRLRKDDALVIQLQAGRYRAEGFDCTDLIESNLMMFRLDHPKIGSFFEAWWKEIDRGSRRDQLSFNYALRQAGGEYFPLTSKPNSVRNHPALALFHHNSQSVPYAPLKPRGKNYAKSYKQTMAGKLELQRQRTADIVVCVHNALEVVEPCLLSVAENRNPEKHRIIIVDDASDAICRQWLRSFADAHPNVELIRHDEALGYTRAANSGLRASAADLVVLLNSDTLVSAQWIEKLLDAAFSRPGVGIVGPLSNAASFQSIPSYQGSGGQTAINALPPGYTVARMNEWCEVNTPADELPLVPLVHGFCLAITRETINRIGFLDEKNFPFGYGEENDYCVRAGEAGLLLAVATHTYIYHVKSQSYGIDRRVMLARDGNEKFRELHGRDRIERFVRSLIANPDLTRIRTLAARLY